MATRILSRLHRNQKTSRSHRGRRSFRAHPEALEERSLLSSLSIANAAVLDSTSGTTPMTFTVSLSAPSSQPVTVGYTTVGNGTALAGVDYLSEGGTLTFAPGQTTQTIPVTVVGNPAVRPDVNFTLALSNPTFATIARGVAVGTIVDGHQTLSVGNAAVLDSTSGTTQMTFTVSLSAPSSQPVTVGYTTVGNGTTTAGVDYLSEGGTLTFAPGQTKQSFTVKIVGEPAIGLDKNFTVALSDPTYATITQGQAAGIIVLNAASMSIAPNGVVYALQANGDLYNVSAGAQIATNVKSFAIRNDSNPYVLQKNNDLYLYTPSHNYDFGIVKGFGLRSDGNGYVWYPNNKLYLNTPSENIYFGLAIYFALRSDGSGYVCYSNGDLQLNTPNENINFGSVKGFGLRNDGNGYVWYSNGNLQLNTPNENINFGSVKEFLADSNGNGYYLTLSGRLYENAPSSNTLVDQNVNDFHLQNGPYPFYCDYQPIPQPPQPYNSPGPGYVGYEFDGSFQILYTLHLQGGPQTYRPTISVSWAVPNPSASVSGSVYGSLSTYARAYVTPIGGTVLGIPSGTFHYDAPPPPPPPSTLYDIVWYAYDNNDVFLGEKSFTVPASNAAQLNSDEVLTSNEADDYFNATYADYDYELLHSVSVVA